MAGTIELRDNGIEVVKADDTVLLSLSVLSGYNPRALHVAGDLITVGYPKTVTYKVVGWNAEQCAIEAERVD